MPQNLHAVLVHEARECVLDLVQNLHQLDPASKILLYNGGPDASLLAKDVDWARYGAVVHPTPKRMKWGYLHEFALDCMSYGMDELGFDTLTVVDSDQLGLRAGYSAFLSKHVQGKPRLGMLGSAPPPERGGALSPPAAHALRELDLWRPFLRRFAEGEAKFPHWTFWPSTVFTADAARALLGLWPDPELARILARTKIWATEEVILPTLVALLGFDVEVNPCRHDFVRYRVRYTPAQLDGAMRDVSTYWAHPVPRRYDDPLRAHVRARHAHYSNAPPAPVPLRADPRPVSPIPILREVRAIGGWLSDEEAKLLIRVASDALRGTTARHIVEVGSYAGKATLALGRVAQAFGSGARVAAIDRHDGVVGALDGKLSHTGPTLETFQANMQRAGLVGIVDTHAAKASEVPWNDHIALLVVDGLHDYASVAEDFRHFEPWLAPGGYVAFHDYADYFPGVRRFVDELERSGAWARARSAGTLAVLTRRARVTAEVPNEPLPESSGVSVVSAVPPPELARTQSNAPWISCIMPTADRPAFVPHAIRHFVAQTHTSSELVIVDDGQRPIEALVPDDPRIRYVRLTRKRSIGEKRNVACAAARGEYIAHFDDDDWSGPTRLAYQLAELEADGASIGGLTQVHYFEPATGRAWQYRYPLGGRRWVAGNTLFFRKATWARRPFEHVNVGEDARFVWADRSVAIRVHGDSDFFVALLHGSNVAKKQVAHRFWHPQAAEVVRGLLGADYERYQALWPIDAPGAKTG